MTDFDSEKNCVANPWDELLKDSHNIHNKLLSCSKLSNSHTPVSLISINADIDINNNSQKIKNIKSPIKLIKNNKNENNNSEQTNNIITINEILNIEICKLNIVKILEYQYVITKHLKNNLKNINDFKNELIKKLEWLIKSCIYMKEKYNLPDIVNTKNTDTRIIPRSSYKFCKYNFRCKYLVKNNLITNSCFDQHIVYNYLVIDLDHLFNYINLNTVYNIDEIQKCINTIYYVINHIKEELENLRIF